MKFAIKIGVKPIERVLWEIRAKNLEKIAKEFKKQGLRRNEI